MTAEGAIGLAAGITAGSIALTGWALGSAVEGLASIIVVWRFTGARTMSESAERRAQRGVAISFWLLAPYIAIEAVRDLAGDHQAAATILGIALTASSVVIMPVLGITKQRLGRRLGSGATAGEGTQNLMCAAQAAAVLLGLAVVAIWPAGWPIDPVIALGIAGWSAWEGHQVWRRGRLLLASLSSRIDGGANQDSGLSSQRNPGERLDGACRGDVLFAVLADQ